MVIFTTAINLNLDFVPLLFFFFLYSALEILITTAMADYRFIQIEDEEEFEDETDETEDEEDEIEENLIPERINLPVDLNLIDELEDEDDSDYDNDDDDDDDDDDEEEDDEEYLIPEGIILPVNIDLINQLVDDDSDYDDDDDDDDDDDEEEDYEDDEDYEDEEVEELIPVEMTSPNRVDRSVVMDNVWLDNSNGFDTCDGKKEEVNRCEIDGLICPICFEAWTSGGQHKISCLPCGHIYGLSCIKKWLLQRRSSGKCPQCNSLCTLKDVRVLYASRLCVADEELHKRVRSLEDKCAYLERKAAPLTHDELINQICSNPTLVERLATALADLH